MRRFTFSCLLLVGVGVLPAVARAQAPLVPLNLMRDPAPDAPGDQDPHLSTLNIGATLLPLHALPVYPPRRETQVSQAVDQLYVRDLGGGCEYRAFVRGALRQTRVTAPRAQYEPRLQVHAAIECGGRVRQTSLLTELPDVRLTPTQVVASIESHARIVVWRDGRECTYAPNPQMVNGLLRGGSVIMSCALPRGGGPPALPRPEVPPR